MDQSLVKIFKTYPKNEQIKRHRVHIPKQTTREPHFIHQLTIEYHYAACRFNPLRSNKLLKPYRKLKLIDSFFLYLCQIDKQDAISRNLSLKLKSLSSLQTLNFNFPHGNWLSLEGVTLLSHALGELKSLSKLTLCFNSCWELDDECFHALFQALKKHRNLQSFDLDLSHCRKITKKTIKGLASVLKRSLQSLEEFSFVLSDLTLTKGKALHLLDSGLPSLTRLKKLKMRMTNVKIEPENDCFSSFQHLKSLRMLDLDVPSLHRSPILLQRFSTSLKSLTNLHTLSLNFRYAETFFVREMEVITQGLQELTLIEKLTLDFSNSPYLNDQALEKLSVGLRTLTNLSRIILQCGHCRSIGDAGVASVIHSLEYLHDLHTVILEFRGCSPIKNDYYWILKRKKNIINLTFDYENGKK